MESREKALAKNTFIISLGTLLPKLTSIITLPILTGYLTISEYGTYDLITILVSLFLPMVTLQIQTGAFRFLIERRENKEDTDKIVTNIIAFIIPVSFCSLTILYATLRNFSTEIRILTCLYLFADMLLLTAQQIIRGFSNNKLYSASSIIRSSIDMFLIVFLVAFAGYKLEGALVSSTIAALCGLLFLIFKGDIIRHINFLLISKTTLKQLLSYSWPLVPNSLSNWILRASDRLIVTLFLGIEANAVYATATKIPALLGTVQSTFSFAWQENASLASEDEDVSEYYTHMYDQIFCILTGITALLIAIAPLLFLFLISDDYNDAYSQIPILFMSSLFSCIASFMGGIYVAHKKTLSVGITTIIAAGINLATNLLMVNIIGIYAASISTLIAYLFLSFERMAGVKQFQKIDYDFKKIALHLAILIFMCFLCWINTLLSNILNFIIGFCFAFVTNKNSVFPIVKGFINKYIQKK